MKKRKINQLLAYLPLTESRFYILLTLIKPLHGYGIIQEVKVLSKGSVKLGPGTVYGALSTLEKDKLIEKVRENGRRKEYLLTRKGAEVLLAQINRVEIMRDNGKARKEFLKNIKREHKEYKEFHS